MEDGASSHTAAATQARFDELKVARLPCWPCNSPDLNPCDYFLWSQVKAELKTMEPAANVAQLRVNLNIALDAINPKHIQAACRQFRGRLQMCVREKGGSFQHMMPKSK